MTKLLQINITANWGSHGKIAEGIGKLAISKGWDSYIAYGRWSNPSTSVLYHIGSMIDERIHGVFSRIFDNHGLMSKHATKNLIKFIEEIDPDIIHLHNIHGYYLNYPMLMNYLARSNKIVVWTLHDCWPYTGHCAHYMYVKCNKWQKHCHNCIQKNAYPCSLLYDHSSRNYSLKKKYFLLIPKLTIVPVSKWLENELQKSFLSSIPCHQIYNGINLDVFKPSFNINIRKQFEISESTKIILGIASNWYRKGLEDFIKLAGMVSSEYKIILVGINKNDKKLIPANIITITRTENIDELRNIYTQANVYFNPTQEDNFPTTNIESLACGTPVVTYNTGGSPEAIDSKTGFVIIDNNLLKVKECIEQICCSESSDNFSVACRERAIKLYNMSARFEEYFNLYERLLKKDK